MVENERMHQFFIMFTSGLNFLINFCGDDSLIIEIIFTKLHEKIHSFTFLNEWFLSQLS